jgi:hypothetical protein
MPWIRCNPNSIWVEGVNKILTFPQLSPLFHDPETGPDALIANIGARAHNEAINLLGGSGAKGAMRILACI